MKIEQGNLENVGWFIGNGVNKNSLFFSNNCQIKWAKHPKGLKKVSGIELNNNIRTVVVLISGKWLTKFPNESKEVVLCNPGDYLAFTGEYHENEAIEASHVIVIRWDPLVANI